MDRALEVGIALILVFFLGGLICSAMNEFVAAAVALRARFLEKGIRHLLADDATADALYDRPMIRSLFCAKRKPSYIPSGAFATSVLDLLVPPDTAAADPQAARAQVATAIEQLPAGRYRESLASLWRSAEADVDRFRAGIETWFDNTMERVGGWYRRRVQWIVLFFAFAVAIGLNINTVVIVQRLWNDDVLRDAAVSRAGALAEEGDADGGGEPSFDRALDDIEKGVADLNALDLPIGWAEGVRPDSVPTAAVGWLLSGLAFSFGAPFWFDLLSRVAPLRATGAKQATTKSG